MTAAPPLVGIIMGSKSDWETMRHAAEMLAKLRRAARVPGRLGPPHAGLAVRVRRRGRGARPGGDHRRRGRRGAPARHGRRARRSCRCWACPVESTLLNGLDSLLSIVQMPGGVPVGTLAIGKAGAINAALLAASILAVATRAARAAARLARVAARRRPGPPSSDVTPFSRARRSDSGWWTARAG